MITLLYHTSNWRDLYKHQYVFVPQKTWDIGIDNKALCHSNCFKLPPEWAVEWCNNLSSLWAHQFLLAFQLEAFQEFSGLFYHLKNHTLHIKMTNNNVLFAFNVSNYRNKCHVIICIITLEMKYYNHHIAKFSFYKRKKRK